MKFLQLTAGQLAAFAGLKTAKHMRQHGPLQRLGEVPTHTHDEQALYVVSEGAAVCETGDFSAAEVLSMRHPHNAVLVERNEKHGWLALAQNTLIEHAFGQAASQVLVTA